MGEKTFVLSPPTAFDFQGAVLFVEGVPPQIHHASCCGGYSGKDREQRQRVREKGEQREPLLPW